MSEFEDEFKDWLLRGHGEALLGAIIKCSAGNAKARISKRLLTPNLFPHLEHEDRMALERLEISYKQGGRMFRKGKARNQAVAKLLDSDVKIRLTEDDLKPHSCNGIEPKPPEST